MIFPHRDIRNYTWTSPGGKTYNKTDHILIDRRWHSSTLLVDIRSFKDAAIEKLKIHKSPGNDKITADLIKAGGRTIRYAIHTIF